MSTTYTPDGQSYHASLTLPSDGDPAVVASVNAAGLQRLGDNTSYLRLLLGPVFNVENFGAVGNNTADDTPAIQAAIDACSAAGGGTVIFPNGVYRTTGPIFPTPNVNMIGAGYSTYINLDHATANLMTWSNASNPATATVISGLRFGANVANTGYACYVAPTYAVRLIFDNCSWNQGSFTNLNSYLVYNNAEEASITLQNCEVQVKGSAAFGAINSTVTGRLNVVNSRLITPAAYTGYLIYYSLGAGVVQGSTFDFSQHSSGAAPIGVSVSSGANTPISISGNRYISAGTGPTKYALNCDSNANVVSSGNSYYSVNRYNNIGSLAPGSELDLLPSTYASSGGTTMTLSNGVRVQHVRLTSTAPTITLPAMYYDGQPLTLTVMNDTGAGWAGVAFKNPDGSAIDGPLGGSIGAGNARSYNFVVGTPKTNNVYVWVMAGEQSSVFIPA